MMNPGAMFANGSDPNKPSNNPNFGAPASFAHNGYPSYNNYALPPQFHGYYNNQYPSQSAPAHPAAHADLYGGYSNHFAPPPPPSYYDPVSQAPVAPQYPSKPKRGKGSKRTSYNVSGNRISGNKGDHNGVFNVGNKNTRYNDEED